MCFKKKQRNDVATFAPDFEHGKDIIPEDVEVIRLDADNNRFFYRIRGEVKNPDVKVVATEHVQIKIARNGILMKADGSQILKNGMYKIYDEENLNAKKGLFGKKITVKPVTVDISVFNSALSYQGFWGTSSPIRSRDPETQIPVDIKSRGTFNVKIADPEKFQTQLVGNEKDYTVMTLMQRIHDEVLQKVVKEIATILQEHRISYVDFAYYSEDIANKVQERLSEQLIEQYGLFVPIFSISDLLIDDEVRAKIEEKLQQDRDETKYKKEAKELAAEAERLDDKYWEREKFLLGLKREDESKYLEVMKILGYPHKPLYPHQEPQSEAPKANAFCPKCGAPVEEGETYCPKCGEMLRKASRVCPHCGKQSNTRGKYCPHCGKEF